jgi:hypothetical protein
MGSIMGSPDTNDPSFPQLPLDLLTRLVRALEAIAACWQASAATTTVFLNREGGVDAGSPLGVGEWSLVPEHLRRIADALDPPPPDVVGSPYVAQRLGCTATWVADLVRRGDIPASCLVPGTGKGKPWKFHRSRIDRWIESR